jgi:hypothetical protein
MPDFTLIEHFDKLSDHLSKCSVTISKPKKRGMQTEADSLRSKWSKTAIKAKYIQILSGVQV